MDKKYQVAVFGKANCPKCKTLNKRLAKILKKEKWSRFEKRCYDVETVEGLVAFSESECVNPQRIPAFVVMQSDGEGDWQPVGNPAVGKEDAVCKQTKLHQYLGLQTDYTDTGKGVISTKMIESVFAQANGGS